MGLIILVYSITSIIITYPLVFKLGNFLPGQPNDAYVYLWNIWNFWHQIITNNNPYFTDYVMYPIGANLYFHTYAPLISIVAFPFLNDLSLFMGMAIILSVLLCSLFSYYLFYKLTDNKIASFIGGLIYGLSPIINSFIQSQHYYFLFSAIFYPIGVLCLIKFIESKRIRFLLLSMSLFWVTLSIDYYSTVLYSLLITTFFFLNQKLSINLIIKSVISGIIILLIPFLFIYRVDKNFREFIDCKQNINTSSSCNANLLGFITPNRNNPIIGIDYNVNLDTPSYYLGWGLLLLAIISAIKNKKQKYIKGFVFIFILFFLLSLGTSDKIYTPFYYFLKIPILGSIDCPIRFPIILQLCLSVFITLFISKHKNIIKASILVFLLLLVEYGVINKDFSSTKVPEVYRYIYTQPNNKTLLEIPSGITESKSAFGYDWSIQALHSQQMYWQSVYQKPRIGVYMSRLTPDRYNFFKTEPVISDVFRYTSAGGGKPTGDLSEIDISKFIKKFNLGYVVLSPNNRQNEFSNFIEEEFKNYIFEKKSIEGFVYYGIK